MRTTHAWFPKQLCLTFVKVAFLSRSLNKSIILESKNLQGGRKTFFCYSFRHFKGRSIKGKLNKTFNFYCRFLLLLAIILTLRRSCFRFRQNLINKLEQMFEVPSLKVASQIKTPLWHKQFKLPDLFTST